MCWRKVIVTGSFETGAVHDALLNSTRNGSLSNIDPLLSTRGSDTDSAASPAVLSTVAPVVATYSLSRPGVNTPKLAGAPSVSDSVADTEPPTPPSLVDAAYVVAPTLAL